MRIVDSLKDYWRARDMWTQREAVLMIGMLVLLIFSAGLVWQAIGRFTYVYRFAFAVNYALVYAVLIFYLWFVIVALRRRG